MIKKIFFATAFLFSFLSLVQIQKISCEDNTETLHNNDIHQEETIVEVLNTNDKEEGREILDCNAENTEYGELTVWCEPVAENFSSAPIKNLSIGEYEAELFEGADQWIVDAENMAAMFGFDGKTIIADHASQGFKVIASNDTAIVCNQLYTKVSQYRGTHTDDIWLNDGRYYTDVPDGELIMYTCDGQDGDVIITYWTKVSES